MNKGVTAEQQIEAGRKAREAGMELSEYWMPGLGGRKYTREHALESARVLNAVNPDFIRLRSLRAPERIPLHQKLVSGEFEQLSDDEVIEEIRLFIENLDGITSFVASDHMMNLLPGTWKAICRATRTICSGPSTVTWSLTKKSAFTTGWAAAWGCTTA